MNSIGRRDQRQNRTAMKVSVDVDESDLDGDYGTVPGLVLTCTRCGHSVEVFGTEDRSAERGAVMLREDCPRGENNFYDVSGQAVYGPLFHSL